MFKKLFFFLLFSCLCLTSLARSAAPVQAADAVYKPITPFQLEQDIEDFHKAGAKGYLVWQYSGDRGGGQEFQNDQFSWFRNIGDGPAICASLKKEADAHPDMFIGVNMADAGQHAGILGDHFSYLHNSCGVTVVRVFAYQGDLSAIPQVLAAASATSIKIIYVIGDYSNGGGQVPKAADKAWYSGGYGAYKSYASQVLAAVKGNSGLYGIELANEAHCGGDASALPAYMAWTTDMTGLVKSSGVGQVGIGQMAENDTTRCDSPGPGDFGKSNTGTGVTMASGHYYSQEEKDSNLAALKQTPGGVLFYIGEASTGKIKDKPEEYYLYPIQGLPTPTAPADENKIVNDLIDQGYQMQCSVPKITVQAMKGGQIGDLETLAERDKSYVKFYGGMESDQNFDYSHSQIPLLRDQNPVADLFNSLEDFYGFQSLTNPKTNIQGSISSAPIYVLLTQEQQCQQKVKILETTESLCNKLEDPSTCALYQPIPSSTYTTHSLLDAYRGGGDTLSCSNVFNGDKSNLSSLNATQQDIMNAVMRTPLYLDRAFRLAFLVVVTDLKPEDPNTLFNFLRKDGSSEPRQDVHVIAFKIPDFGTNKPLDANAYVDPLQLTRNAILTTDQIAANNQKTAAMRADLKVDKGANQINCTTQTCTDPLVRAVVDLINRSPFQSCDVTADDLKYEPVNQINSSGQLQSNPGTQFKDQTDPAARVVQDNSGQASSGQTGVFKFISNLRLGLKGPTDTNIRGYLVLPVGDEQKSIEMALLSLFDKTWADNYLKDPDILRYYKITGVDQKLNGPDITAPFYDPLSPATCHVDPVTHVQTCNSEAKLTVAADESDSQPRLPFGGIGYLTKIIQTQLHQVESRAFAFLSSCETTEDFLLGNCGGYTRVSNPNAPAGSAYLSQEVIPTTDCKSIARVGAGPSTFSPACTVGGKSGILYSSALDIASWKDSTDSDATLCSPAFLKSIVCTDGPGPTGDGEGRQGSAPALVAHKVDDQGNFTNAGTMTACDYVVQQAKAHGVSPRLALAMWGEESGWSAYTTAGGNEDFGVKSAPSSRSVNNISQQVNAFLNTINSHTSYLEFLLYYSGEADKSGTPPVCFANNPQFPDRLKTFYQYMQ